MPKVGLRSKTEQDTEKVGKKKKKVSNNEAENEKDTRSVSSDPHKRLVWQNPSLNSEDEPLDFVFSGEVA